MTVRSVPHIGPTNGYRLERDGVSVAYISDHQQPLDGSLTVPDAVLELCDDADLVIHDAQYTAAEFESKAHWGHCTVDFAVQVAAQSGARRLALFHHDPEPRRPRWSTRLARQADERARRWASLEVRGRVRGRHALAGRVAAAARSASHRASLRL